jgi:hypothetical protein
MNIFVWVYLGDIVRSFSFSFCCIILVALFFLFQCSLFGHGDSL